MTVRSTVRWAVYGLINGLGLSRAIAGSPWRRKRLLVLCYHGFSMADEHRWSPSLYMQPDTFRRRLTILREGGYRVIPLGEGVELLREGRLPPRSVAITVDDGSKNFISAGYAVLQELRVSVTLYVSSYYVFKRLPVFNACASYLLWRGAQAGVRLERQVWLDQAVRLNRGNWLPTFHLLLASCARHGLDAGGKHALLPGLADEVGVDFSHILERELFHLMSPGELASLDPKLVDLQLHTHRHTMPADSALAEREIRENRAALSKCGKSAESLVDFCYPSGVYHPDQLGMLRALGIRSATTCVPGMASRSTDPMLLPRFIDNEAVSEAAFRCWVSGSGALLRGLRPS